MKDSRQIKYGAVIVAAGMSTRMKRFKQLMRIDGISFAERVITNFLDAGVSEIVMVTGFKADQLEHQLKGFPVRFVHNPGFAETEMFDSAKMGLYVIQNKADRVFFCPVDVPFFTVDTVKAEMKSTSKIVIPTCEGRDGHPLLMDAELIPHILSYKGKGGLKAACGTLSEKYVERIIVSDEGSVLDADTREDFEKLVELHNSRILHVKACIKIVSTSEFFDSDTLKLFEKIDKCKSVRRACEECGISYSKGWKVIATCESRLGFRVVERITGGKNGGSSSLTEKGLRLTEAFKVIQKEVSAMSNDVFDRVMKEYGLI